MKNTRKRRFLTITLSVVLLFQLLSLSGCIKNEALLPLAYARTDVDPQSVDMDAVLRRLDNKMPAPKLVTCQYPLSELGFCGNFQPAFSLNGFVYSTALLEAETPIECLRQTDNHLYVAYKVAEGGWLYIFLQPKEAHFNGQVVQLSANDQTEKLSHTLYIKEKADKKALTAIGEGSSFADVCAADPTAATVKEYGVNRAPGATSRSLHWCDNEIFIFTYDESGETVTGVEHYPDGRVPSSIDGWYFDYNLLPVDRI